MSNSVASSWDEYDRYLSLCKDMNKTPFNMTNDLTGVHINWRGHFNRLKEEWKKINIKK